MRTAAMSLVVLCLTVGSARSQDSAADDVQAGHHVASALCSICHVATPDQATQPILHPPAPPFASIVQRKDITADSLRNFLMTTHRGLDHPKGMPNPDLADFQVRQVVAYLMSLRK
jgi:mono/diheme cytochrome c family protein